MAPRLRYPEIAPAGIAPLRGLEHYLNAETALPPVLLELVRLRVSLRNGCDFCIGHHTEELRKHNEPQSRIAALPDWVSSDAFTPRERAALAWADAVTDIQSRHAGDAEYAAVSTFFPEKDLVDLTLAIASINAWNRLSIAFRAEWAPHHRKETSAGGESRTATTQQSESSSTAGAVAPASSLPAPMRPDTGDAVDDDGGKVAQD